MLTLTLNNLATTYHLLPSEVLERGNTLDMYVLDVGSRYIKYQQDKEQGLVSTASHQPTQAELLAMIERTKQKGANNE